MNDPQFRRPDLSRYHNPPSKRNIIVNRSKMIALLLLSFALMVSMMYLGSRPKTYSLKINDASPYDIEAPRSIIDKVETNKRAEEAMAAVPNKMIQSKEITEQSLSKTKSFMDYIAEVRAGLYKDNASNPSGDHEHRQPSESEVTTAGTGLIAKLNQALQVSLSPQDARTLLMLSPDRYQMLSNGILEAARLIMQNPQTEDNLQQNIANQVAMMNGGNFSAEDQQMARNILGLCLRHNVVFNEDATRNAKEDARNRVLQNPILINRGARIVSQGEIITEDKYERLKELDLIDSGLLDWQGLGGQALIALVIVFLAYVYIRKQMPEVMCVSSNALALALAFFLPLAISAYIGQAYQLSPPVYFAAVILSTYYGFECAVFFSSLLVAAVMPIVNFNPGFLIVALIGTAVAALFAKGFSAQDNLAKLIIATALSTTMSSLAYSFIQHDSWAQLSLNMTASGISGVASVVTAIGFMPLFELLFNTVSPLRLIELSQPGHPLLRRLFLEAPGTSQHSMMVATLADAAADEIGANALLCRVGAYYHDIGKLEAPLMFTENQEGYNPHDRLTPEESTAIITRHPDDGLKMAKRYRLPAPIMKIIHEHHGTTVLQYFYAKAKEIAKQEGRPEPDINLYRYHTPIPSSRESAVVMLADSTEAAMKSTGCHDLESAEKLMRNIFKIKNEQNQLIQSGLSFAEVEKILQAFLQVYAGHFHERIKYPDAQTGGSDPQLSEKN